MSMRVNRRHTPHTTTDTATRRTLLEGLDRTCSGGGVLARHRQATGTNRGIAHKQVLRHVHVDADKRGLLDGQQPRERRRVRGGSIGTHHSCTDEAHEGYSKLHGVWYSCKPRRAALRAAVPRGLCLPFKR